MTQLPGTRSAGCADTLIRSVRDTPVRERSGRAQPVPVQGKQTGLEEQGDQAERFEPVADVRGVERHGEAAGQDVAADGAGRGESGAMPEQPVIEVQQRGGHNCGAEDKPGEQGAEARHVPEVSGSWTR